jgi:hypothetical protein
LRTTHRTAEITQLEALLAAENAGALSFELSDQEIRALSGWLR